MLLVTVVVGPRRQW